MVHVNIFFNVTCVLNYSSFYRYTDTLIKKTKMIAMMVIVVINLIIMKVTAMTQLSNGKRIMLRIIIGIMIILTVMIIPMMMMILMMDMTVKIMIMMITTTS